MEKKDYKTRSTNIKVTHDTLSKENEIDTFSLQNYGSNLNKQLNYINNKIEEAEIKITSLKSKEKIIDDMIDRSNRLVERYTEEKNYKLAGINSSYILTQFETLAQVQEMLIKYEDMIQKYIKMSIDIENHKINAFVKLNSSKKEESKNEEGYEKIMNEMHKMMQNSENQGSPHELGTPSNDALLNSVKDQLKLEGY
jgi:hypothetical protein